MKCRPKKKGHHFPDDQFLAQNIVKTKKKRSSRLADVGYENTGGDAAELSGGYIPLDLYPWCLPIQRQPLSHLIVGITIIIVIKIVITITINI